MTSEELRAFERDIANEFEAGHIKAPVHLHGGNEDQLIEIFRDIKPEDFVFSTHRSHYHALLHGVPPELVKAEIMKGNSISLQFPEYHFFTSAIVGGICPIALGVAMAIEMGGLDSVVGVQRTVKWDISFVKPRVWVFVGDMAAHTGLFVESLTYGMGQELPICFIEEDNSLSVDTPTGDVWGVDNISWGGNKWFRYYQYTRTYPHQGSGKWVTF